MILQHLYQFPSLPICHWCPPIPLEGQFFFFWEMWKSLYTEVVSPEIIGGVAIRLISVDSVSGNFWCLSFSGKLLKCGQFSGRNCRLLPWSNNNECLLSHRKHGFLFFPWWEFPLLTQLMLGWVGTVVLKQAAMLWTFLSALSITRAICLAWSKFNFFSANIHLQIWSSATPTTSKSPNISWIVGPNLQNFDCLFQVGYKVQDSLVVVGTCKKLNCLTITDGAGLQCSSNVCDSSSNVLSHKLSGVMRSFNKENVSVPHTVRSTTFLFASVMPLALK